MNRIIIATFLALLAFVASYEVPEPNVLAQRDQEGQFIVSILRADGTLIPFAQYGNGGWWNPWPKPRQPAESIYKERTEVPHSLGDLTEPWFIQCGKVPRTWYFWSSADTLTVLKASKVVQVRGHSETNWALLTDLPGQTSEDALHSQIGIALNVNTKVNPMVDARPDTAEDKNIASFIKQTFEDAETDELNRIRGQRPVPEFPIRQFSLTKEERANTVASITKLYRSKSLVNGEHLYYFEAEKSYAQLTAQGTRTCEDISLFRGWILTQDKGGLGLLDSQLMLTDCDRKGPSTATPLGIMTLKSQTFLFVSEHGWEDERYVILELDNSGLHRVLETRGG